MEFLILDFEGHSKAKLTLKVSLFAKIQGLFLFVLPWPCGALLDCIYQELFRRVNRDSLGNLLNEKIGIRLKSLNEFERTYLFYYNRSFRHILKAISRKKHSIKGGGLKNLSGLFTGEGMPRFKKIRMF